MRETVLSDTPNIDDALFPGIDCDRLFGGTACVHPPRILILYGSLRSRSFSRLAAEEAARILTRLGAEVRVFNPSGLPLVDDGVDASHRKVRELRDLVAWCEGMVWSSPERHGAMGSQRPDGRSHRAGPDHSSPFRAGGGYRPR